MNLGLLGLPSNERSYGPAHDTQSPEQGGGCRCLPNLLDRLWFSLHQLRFCPPKPIAWNRCGVFSPPRPIVHIQQGFDFLGYRMVRTSGNSKIPRGMIQRWNPKGLIAYPTRKSIRRFRDRVQMLTRRSAQRKTAALIEELNPTLRGWAEYYKRAHVRTLFHKLDGWIVRRIWSHRFRRLRTRGWIQLPKAKLYAEFGLVNLISLIPSLGSHSRSRASS